jgi:hypothetical protein
MFRASLLCIEPPAANVLPIRLATGLANMPSGSSSAAQGGGRAAPRTDRFGCGKDVAQFTKSA